METSSGDDLTQAQNELYRWIKEFMKDGAKVLSLNPGGLIYQVMKTVDY